MLKRVFVAFVCVAVAIVSPVTVASAAISGTSDQITKINPPASVRNGALVSATTMFAFNEQQGVSLASSLKVDITAPGNYTTVASLPGGTINAGTVVDSHFVNSDRSSATGPSTLTGTLTFPTDVVGVIVTGGKLFDSDVLGAPGTLYPTSGMNRALELPATGTEDGIFMPNLRTVTIRSSTSTELDQVRILTKHDSPPTASAGGPYTGTEGSPGPCALRPARAR